ncbi:MAG: NAD-dependent epimerase/dehydratase family protein [Phycisphaerae bacterium]|nr:NAD-dependent epimerase/dehydratase family protein [Phycisphaerae bacterium]
MPKTTRREFLSSSLSAAAALSLAPAALARPRSEKLRILILGGTGFLGPACVDAAMAKGHTLTLFNRGLTEKRKGGMFPTIEKLQGDRDPNKGDGLKALEGREWDAVIDTSSYYPRMAKASAELLAKNIKQYLIVSTVSVYKHNDQPNQDESGEIGTIPDTTVEEMGAQFENYGPLKALCEAEVEKAMPGRACIVRPGYIVGPGDPTPRFNYWPWRVSLGGEMLAPGTPTDPVQIIDVRDLGEWIIHLIEQRTTGIFNALGPKQPLDMGAMLDGCKKGVSGDAKFIWVDADFLESQGVQPPIWIPPKGEYIGFHTRSAARAFAAGFTTRPVSDTAKATLDWLKTLPEDRRARLVGALPSEKEKEVLAAFKAK